ncbi:hypothetical protein, partial [Brevundimonas sp.]|uniref:hypothetical protein n=1 Tax=Brevundimonas sp. TaxID=1871086 RepID=UPI002EDAC79F
MRSMRANRFSRLAGLVEQLAAGLEPDRIPVKSRQASIVELDSLWALLDGHPDDADGALAAALWGLRTRLAEADGTRRPRVADAARNRRLA